jgi:hypothetical protein
VKSRVNERPRPGVVSQAPRRAGCIGLATQIGNRADRQSVSAGEYAAAEYFSAPTKFIEIPKTLDAYLNIEW